MSKFVIEGGNRLQGSVRIQGSKNAAFPVIAATILAEGPSRIQNVPDISDVRNFLHVLEVMGAEVKFANHCIDIDTRDLKNQKLSTSLVGNMRGSILFAGPLLARFGEVSLPFPGGDAIGARPIDVHLDGFRKLGAQVVEQAGGIEISAASLTGTKIVLGVTSVTGTENLVLASIKARGVTEIRLAATEPHVLDLCRALIQMGAKIEGLGTTTLRITGVERLVGTNFTLCADEIDAVTFCVATAVTRGEATITGVDLKNLDAPLNALEKMGVNFTAESSEIKIFPPAGSYQATRIITGVFPQLLTDEQPLLGVLATQSSGETSIHDWIYEGRQGYLKALCDMGAKVEFEDVHRARIFGPTELRGAEIMTPDIRAGASILIAALVAKGRTILYNAEIIDRGYERLDERFRSLGANIQRVE